jgi:hypothetical protein
VAPRINLELLAQRELEESLITATSEESQNATEDRERERRGGPHRRSILLEFPGVKED